MSESIWNLDVVVDSQTGEFYLFASGKFYQLDYERKESFGLAKSKSQFLKVGTLRGIGVHIREAIGDGILE